MPIVTPRGKVYVRRDATTPTITNRPRFVTGTSSNWGILSWDEESVGDNYVEVDILKASDESLLVGGLRHRAGGHNLLEYPNVASNDIKLRFKFNVLDKTPIVRNVVLDMASSW